MFQIIGLYDRVLEEFVSYEEAKKTLLMLQDADLSWTYIRDTELDTNVSNNR